MAKFLFFITVFNTFFGFSQTVSTVAGTTSGYLDGSVNIAQFKDPLGICTDNNGNIFVADRSNNRIRKIDASGTNMVTTIAGSGVEGYADGIGTSAIFGAPTGICIDALGNLYVTDFWNFKIRKITPTGVVTTLAGSTQGFANGNGTAAQFDYLEQICIDALGNLYVADAGNSKIRKITPSGTVTTVAGTTSGYLDGVGTIAKFDYPNGICIDGNNNLYVAEYFSHKIRKITPTGVVSTVAGSTWGFTNGQSTTAQFRYPTGIGRDTSGNLYVTDSGNNMIRKITLSGMVSTYTGSENNGYLDGSLNNALFSNPWAIHIKNNVIYVSEGGSDKIRKITSNLSSENFESDNFKLFPNPTTGAFTIEVPNTTISKVSIYDVLGRMVFTENTNSSFSYTFQNKFLNKGMYKIVVTTEKGSFTKSLLVN
ncbi:T9SS type A sorting domain-containing protein [Flavobacterium sp. F372]|uniref:T9SS type A sorting domain-containing protein n=1 Tax=Flavobacterium bernardetii TaxID=2813823 RepID=A0ABR7J0G7_9FLAO|nr:NHL repeat-containing protein [Flavobacterium bernardetii]MBC5835531.1 T9SS type A sorting domain-containing protein [Flavobacterium bernardetii]NHF70895.1 T9SS type A sorting domain-containing protein [Flavobacterium bernardetii]